MRFLFFTDPHIRGDIPKARKDNFPETIFNKLTEIVAVAKELEVEAILCGGDWFHTATVAESVVYRTNKILLPAAKSDIPIYTVLGNHDEIGYNPETHDKTALGTLCSAGLVKRLGEQAMYFHDGKVTVAITGCDSHHLLDRDGRKEDYLPSRPSKCDVHLHIIHGFLADRRWHEEVPHTLIDDIIDTPADLVLSGHEHAGYGEIRRGGKIFCNPGALSRISASMSEMTRMPQYIIIDIMGAGVENINIEIKIPACAKPSADVLDREILEKEIERQRKIQGFSATLGSFSVESLNIYHVVERIAAEDRVPEEVRAEAKKRLQKADEDMALEKEHEQ